MSRRSERGTATAGRRRTWAWSAVAAAGLAAGAAAQDDALAAYLESQDLRSLLVTRLEQLVADASPDARAPLLERLAALYAELLDAAESPEDRRRLLDRAAELVDAAGREGTESLELAIARADYRTAERVAEQWRVRSIEPEALDAAGATLADVADVLDRLSERVQRILERSRNQSNRATGTRAIEVSETLDTALLLQGEIDYLAGWTAYYRGWLGDPGARLVEAEERFELLLELGDAGAIPSAVDLDLIAGEGYARAVLGMALVRGLSARTDEVLRWLAPLQTPDAHPAVRAEVPGWRLSVLVDDGAWRRVRDELDLLVGEDDVPADWYRLVAARAMETEDDPLADLAARTAVAELGRRGELAVLYALAERYGTDRLGDRGFLVRYVQAAAEFSRAAETVGRRVGAGPAERQTWREVAGALRLALDAPDAETSPGAAADAERLLGWALWYAGDADLAWPRFAAAAERLPPTAAAEAAWMTIVSLDQLVLAGRGEMREEVARRTDAFLERFPGHASAPALRARRIAARPDAVAGRDLEALLAVPAGHPQWRTSRETVAAVLARRYRAGGDRDEGGDDASASIEAGEAYLDVAAELLAASDAEGAGVARPPSRAEVDAARLTLEIALDPRIADLDRAGEALARLDAWRSGSWTAGSLAPELRYRAVQWALAGDRWADAAARATAFATDTPFSDVWSRAALVRVLAGAAQPGAIGRRRTTAAWRLAEPVLEAVDAAATNSADGLRLALAAARVGERVMRESRDDAAAARVLEAMTAVRAVHPGERGVLQVLGRVAAAQGDETLALECWRTLSDGLSPPDPDWYEARFELASLLARVDRERARRVMRQHAALEPDYGPAPWGPRLRALHDRLEEDAAEDAPDGGDP